MLRESGRAELSYEHQIWGQERQANLAHIRAEKVDRSFMLNFNH